MANIPLRLNLIRRLASRLALTLVLTAMAFGAAPIAQASVFEPETFTLNNGMQVVVITNRRVPVVSHMVWYKVGAADEPPGQSGIAHFLEHLMFRGTENFADGVFSQTVRRNGGNDNAFTSWDYTAYFQNIAVDRLPVVMAMEADRMVNLRLSEDIVEVERDVILQERQERIDSRPGARLGEQMIAALYRNHPYGIPIIGWEHEMRALTVEQLQAFYDRWYKPNNAILVVSGDIDAETLRPLAEETYGVALPGDVMERTRPMEPESGAERVVMLRDPTVRQPSWRRFYSVPSYRTDSEGLAYAGLVLSQILGGGDLARLYRSMVVDQQLVVGVGTSYSPQAFDLATFGVSITPHPNPDWEVIEAAFQAEVEKLINEGITEEELADAKQRMTTSAIYARDSIGGPARTLGAALSTGRTVEDVESWPAQIQAVTADQVVEAARQFLKVENSVTGFLLPEAEQGS